ncbi:MAG TPA: ribose 5-phosphate isomerase B [Ignavibacteriaceae bacterium]|nr:ribose 5-phosphate isomerase B [Ignavibacteriaceae bacterium]
MKIAVASDHGGFELKKFILDLLKKEKEDITDLGNVKFDPADDYPDFAELLAKKISGNEFDRGILICGSGVGACIAANKIKGVRAAVCHDTYSARQGVEHDDMNILCIGARVIGEKLAEELVHAFLKAEFSKEERFLRRLEKVLNIEKKYK